MFFFLFLSGGNIVWVLSEGFYSFWTSGALILTIFPSSFLTNLLSLLTFPSGNHNSWDFFLLYFGMDVG